MTARPDALLVALADLGAHVQDIREIVSAVNNDDYAMPKDTILKALSVADDLLKVHREYPNEGVVRDLDGLSRALLGVQVPVGPAEDADRSYAFRELNGALGRLRISVDQARQEAMLSYPDMPRIPGRQGFDQIPATRDGVRTVLSQLDAFERAVRNVAREARTRPTFRRQGELVVLYVDDMTFRINLNRLLLTANDVTVDVGALVNALETILDLTDDFRANVTDWFGLVTEELVQRAWELEAPLKRLTAGVAALGGMIEKDPEGGFPTDRPDMVLIRPGSFVMGISEEETKDHGFDWDDHARPQHNVAIPRLFLLGRYPVTVGEYAEFAQDTGRTPKPPEFQQNDRHPAVNVSWDDAAAYCEWLSERTGLHYRLPSEAEWEYACRAGTPTARWWGDAFDPKMANNNDKGTREVDAFPANPWGLHDMIGNVEEWCADPWHEDYKGAPSDGSAWTTGGSNDLRVVRGGSWDDTGGGHRSGDRGRDGGRSLPWVGFRLARTL